MLRNVCSRCLSIGLYLVIFAAFIGCSHRKNARWVNPETVLFMGSKQDIEESFTLRFSGHTSDSDRFFSEDIKTEGSEYLAITSYPYRGPDIFNIYLFEKVSELWQLRIVVPVIDRSPQKPMFVAEGDAVRINLGEATFLKIESVR